MHADDLLQHSLNAHAAAMAKDAPNLVELGNQVVNRLDTLAQAMTALAEIERDLASDALTLANNVTDCAQVLRITAQ